MQAPLETDDTSPQTTAKCKEMVNEACKLLDVELAVAHQVAHQKNREIAHPTASMWQHKPKPNKMAAQALQAYKPKPKPYKLLEPILSPQWLCVANGGPSLSL